MITINGAPADMSEVSRYQNGSIEQMCLSIMGNSSAVYSFSSPEELDFELTLRGTIVGRSNKLYRSGLNFATFRNAYCNERYWHLGRDGGWELPRSASASDAVYDIYENGRKYGTECATAMQIVYYGALADITAKDKFDRQFAGIRMMNWSNISPALREVGNMNRESDYFPSDRRYFKNPDVDMNASWWQGENVIDMGDGTYYGHGVGRLPADQIIMHLNDNRAPGATRTAYLMDSAGRPDFKKLFKLFGPVVRASGRAQRSTSTTRSGRSQRPPSAATPDRTRGSAGPVISV